VLLFGFGDVVSENDVVLSAILVTYLKLVLCVLQCNVASVLAVFFSCINEKCLD